MRTRDERPVEGHLARLLEMIRGRNRMRTNNELVRQIEKGREALREANAERDRVGSKLQRLLKQQEDEAEELLKEETGVLLYRSDDYCGMSCYGYRFYYGYESTVCPHHGNDSHCSCDEMEWAFVAYTRVDKEELLRIPQSKLTTSQEPVLMNLLAGIGQFIDSLKGEI